MVTLRARLFAAFLVLAGLGFLSLIHWVTKDLRPRYLATMEESMVDTATLLSSLVANATKGAAPEVQDLRAVFDDALGRRFAAKIYEAVKTQVNMRVYVTDCAGTVLFDSDHGRDEGKDYSRWNDVHRTLGGAYGARATRTDPEDPSSEILYVASPITVDGEILGVLTVCKPTASVTLFLETARWKIALAGMGSAVAVILLGIVLSTWITRPLEQLTQYAKAVRDGRRVASPRVGRGEIGALATAFEEMRVALEGKRYVEEYVQTLTHQMKSPLSAIRGTTELLGEDMPAEQRRRFLENLRSESARLENLIERMLELSAIENRNDLRDVEELDLREVICEIIASMSPVLAAKHIDASLSADKPIIVRGERFLLRQAISNLLQNAVDFSETGGAIAVSAGVRDGWAEVAVVDNGPGIPEYARDKVFDRFYSLRRPDTGKKSSGLGLAFVKEVAALHGGRVTLDNQPEGGAKAVLSLPLR